MNTTSHNTFTRRLALFLFCGLLALNPHMLMAESGHDHGENSHQQAGHGEHGEEGHEEGGAVILTDEQMKLANVRVESIQPQTLAGSITAPGEVVLNAYATSSVTPRVSAQVIKRHARLGDHLSAGDALVTLSSVEMAQAQGELLVAAREWERVKKLGKKVVSAQRYTEARVAYEQAKARAQAYGMTARELQDFLRSGDASLANGSFKLIAPQNGTVIRDDFVVGELIEPGRELFVISDESTLWVEAKLTPTQALQVRTGASATIKAGDDILSGRVIQVHHALDEETRTLGVRIEIANPDDQLHPGVFVQAIITSKQTVKALAVPVSAVVRSEDGDWQIFYEHEPGEFKPQEVDVVRTVGDKLVIEGIEPGTRVAVSGVFFIQSELAKSGFEIHNH